MKRGVMFIPEMHFDSPVVCYLFRVADCLKPNTRRRRNSTVELSRVSVSGVYWTLRVSKSVFNQC